ncbi:MAG: response regulator [bacterium]
MNNCDTLNSGVSLAWGIFTSGIIWKNEYMEDELTHIPIDKLNNLIFEMREINKDEFSFILNEINFKLYKTDNNLFILTTETLYNQNVELNDSVITSKEFTHDLNNILAAVNAGITLLKSKVKEDEKLQKTINVIENNLFRAMQLAGNMSKSKTEEIVLPDLISLPDLLNMLAVDLQNLLPERIIFTLKIEDNIPLIKADFEDLYRALLNICINSKEAINEKGEIIMNCINYYNRLDNTDYVKVIIKDTGEGIKEENINKIFKSGFSTKKKKTESGIGLSIVKKMITKYYGTIKVNSFSGLGTEFEILFPVISPKPKNIKSPITVTDKEIKKRIIIADDETPMVELLTELLGSYNYEVESAYDGLELIEKIKLNNPYDLIIVDEKMPKLNGLESIYRLRQLNINTNIILCSGSGLKEKTNLFEKLKISKFIKKPYNFDELLENIKNLID